MNKKYFHTFTRLRLKIAAPTKTNSVPAQSLVESAREMIDISKIVHAREFKWNDGTPTEFPATTIRTWDDDSRKSKEYILRISIDELQKIMDEHVNIY